jgi:hypothetical protein
VTMMKRNHADVNCAFSAGGICLFHESLGRLPQAQSELRLWAPS